MPMPLAGIEHERCQIDHEISRWQALIDHTSEQDTSTLLSAILELKLRRNELAPIYNIPAEVLTMIFAIHVSNQDRLGIEFSHVCRFWRNVAINRSTLWTNILPTSSQLLLEEMLRRSRGALLHVKFIVDGRSSECLSRILQEMHRIETLDISAAAPVVMSLFEHLSSSNNLEALRSLSLRASSGRNSRRLISWFQEFFTPAHSSRHLLENLILDGCKLKWNSSLLAGLTSLRIHDPPRASCPTLRQFLCVVKHCPALETLYLSDFSLASDRNRSPRSLITLPLLTTFKLLKFTMFDCNKCLTHLSLPSLASITIECKASRLNLLVKTQKLFNEIARFLNNIGPSTIQSLHLGLDVNATPERTTLVTLFKDSEIVASRMRQMWGTIILPVVPPEVLTPIIVRTLPMRQVHTLVVKEDDDADYIQGNEWDTILSCLPSLEHLEIENLSAEGFLHSLARKHDLFETIHNAEQLCSTNALPLPRLQSLCISKYPYSHNESLDLLSDILEMRRQYNGDLLGILSIDAKPRNFDILKHHVVSLTFTGEQPYQCWMEGVPVN